MARYYANSFIHTVGSKITIFLFILLFLVIINFVIVSYYQSQMESLGNSINIVGKNRFLTSNLLLHLSEYLNHESNTKSSSEIKSAINQLESNIQALRQGEKRAAEGGMDMKSLPKEFSDDWNIIYQKWISFKTNLTNKIIDSTNKKIGTEKSMVITEEASLLEKEALSLIDSSNLLVTKLSDYLKGNSEYSLFIQQIITILLIVVTIAFSFYISTKILKPIKSLTSMISDLNDKTMNVIIRQIKDTTKNNNNNSNELSILSNSFNYMVNYIKNIKKQDEIINELKKANEELKYKDQLKNDFINIAAHEIKTPIQPIIAFAEVLQKEGEINNIEKNKQYLDIIFRNSKRLKQITDDLLDVAKIETGSFFLNKEKFSLREMIIDILKEYEQFKIQYQKNLKLNYESSDNDNQIIIEADRKRLCQVIRNLLNNAIHFTNEGSITVIVKERKKNDFINDKIDEILVSIKDTGTGIHQEILPKLFTKFSTKSLKDGTGLGLFISKSIIEMHGGKIWATNNNEEDRKDLGSTFTFSLPVKE
ncbi:MAG TPA: HAMP domain-containing sensor histidine kinase [Nitrososphaeraceae archaeon]|nr:HAMP domain-containing sensor histidine kinase [Nitrososphaeraceae archaeon]